MGNLYETIAALCEEKGIKGATMCTETGISKGLLTDLKMGRRTGVSAVTAQKIASYFGVTVGYLLGEEEKEEKPTVNDDELSDNMQKLMKWALSVPENKQELAIKLLQTIVEDEQ